MNKLFTGLLLWGISLTVGAQALPSTEKKSEQAPEKKSAIQIRKLQLAEFAITNLYVDEVNEEELVENAIKGMLEKLDPHSAYSNAKEVKRMNEPLQGNFEGVGIQFNMMEDTLLVIQPISDGPSERAGILAGDRIVCVNDTAIAGVKMNQEEIMRRIRGPKGSKVKLGVLRRGIEEKLYFTVIRDKIPLHTLDAAYMIRKGIGYIRLGSFGANTHQEFTEAMKQLKKKGMKDLILDLQGNGGGYLSAAVEIAGEFLNAGELIVYTEGERSPRQEFKAEEKGSFRKGQIIVLIDEYSASAAEIVTGAIQDQDRGIVVGRRSFGKGLVQRPINLPDQSMIRLTVARYYTPAGRCIQKPYDEGKKEYNNDIRNRLNHGELTHADSIQFPDSLQFKTLKQGRTVYGGGGIMPDHFVPLDTTRFNSFHQQLFSKGIHITASLHYVERNRTKILETYKDFEQFEKEFEVPEELLINLKEEADKAKIKYDETQYQEALPEIALRLKALIARDLWKINEYFRIINEATPSIRKAIDLLTAEKK